MTNNISSVFKLIFFDFLLLSKKKIFFLNTSYLRYINGDVLRKYNFKTHCFFGKLFI